MNIGADRYASKYKSHFGSMDTGLNMVNIEQGRQRDEKEKDTELRPESFVLNFLQKKEGDQKSSEESTAKSDSNGLQSVM